MSDDKIIQHWLDAFHEVIITPHHITFKHIGVDGDSSFQLSLEQIVKAYNKWHSKEEDEDEEYKRISVMAALKKLQNDNNRLRDDVDKITKILGK